MSRESAMAVATGQPAPNPATARGALQTKVAQPAAPAARPGERKSPGQLAEEAAAAAHTDGGQQPPAAKEPTQDERMAGLLKKETGLVRDREAFSKEREAFEKEKAGILERAGRADKQLERGKQFDELVAKNDFVGALKLIGLNDNQIGELLAKQGQPVEKTVEQKAKEIVDAELAERDKKKAEEDAKTEQTRNAEVIKTFKGQINTSVEASAETHPLVHYAGSAAQEQIFLNIEERVKAPDYKSVPLKQLIDDAMNDLEELYVYDYDQKAAIRNKGKQPPGQPAEQTETQPNAQREQGSSAQRKPVTVTNQMGTRSTTQQVVHETAEQKRARLENVLRTGDTSLLRTR